VRESKVTPERDDKADVIATCHAAKRLQKALAHYHCCDHLVRPGLNAALNVRCSSSIDELLRAHYFAKKTQNPFFFWIKRHFYQKWTLCVNQVLAQ
jgi:hypothetical protein